MRIISDFKDFYDSGMGLGIDKTVVYNRTTSYVLSVNKIKESEIYSIIDRFPSNRYVGTFPGGYLIRPLVLLICGEAISAIRIEETDGKTNHFYSADKAIDYMKSRGLLSGHYYFWQSRHCIHSDKGVKNFFEDKSFSSLTKLHHTYRCPVILCGDIDKSEGKIKLNPSLKDLGYQTQKDPYTLFQTIYMFLSGVLGAPLKAPEPISDELNAANHGHDGPYSFRKPPGKRGRKQWR